MVKKEVACNSDFLNEFIEDKPHETSDLNMMVVQDEKERIEMRLTSNKDQEVKINDLDKTIHFNKIGYAS